MIYSTIVILAYAFNGLQTGQSVLMNRWWILQNAYHIIDSE